MGLTFIIAEKLGVSPFNIMAQDLEEVIMVVNYMIDSAEETNTNTTTENALTEKEQDRAFWSAL